ncbi:MAG: hypothetical protein KBG15_24305 [Kofleriaceae bacterium]|nr:hypothetical protein [Kofleriaceae bacterium]
MNPMRASLPRNLWRTLLFAAAATLTATHVNAMAAEPTSKPATTGGAPNQGYVVVPNSVSPDGSLQVMIPALAEDAQQACQTRLVEVSSGKTLAQIQGECFFEHQGQITFHPQWSKDGAMLIWHSDNKWGSANVRLLQLKAGKVIKQIDVRGPAVKQVLASMRKLAPKPYAAAKKYGKGAGAWFRDGFAIDVQPVLGSDGVQWPLKVSVDITSDPKCDQPASNRAGGTMQATFDATEKWAFAPFVSGHSTCGKAGLTCAFADCE